MITPTALLYAFLGAVPAHANVFSDILGVLKNPANGFLMLVISALNLLARLVSTLMALLTSFATVLSEPFITGANTITRNPQITAGWEAMRDVANFLLILVLLIAAILIIVKRGSYTVKAVIPKMVTAVLLINFSRLIIGTILDFFHVVTVGLYQLVVPSTLNVVVTEENAMEYTFSMFKIQDIINKIWDGSGMGQEVLTNVQLFVASLFVIVLVFTITVSAVMLIALYVMRFVALAVLTVVAPLAMILDVLPFTQQYYKQYWSQLVKYASMSAALALYLSLAVLLSTVFTEMGESISEEIVPFEEVMTGMPKIEWGTLINILVMFFLVQKGVAFAKSGSFAEGLVNSVEKTANAMGRKPVDKVWGGVKAGAAGAAAFASRPARMAAQNLVSYGKTKMKGSFDAGVRKREATLLDDKKSPFEKARARVGLAFMKSDEDQKKQFESSEAMLKAKHQNLAYVKPEGVAAVKDMLDKDLNRYALPEERAKVVSDRITQNKGFTGTGDMIQQLKLLSEAGIGTDRYDDFNPELSSHVIKQLVTEKDVQAIDTHLNTNFTNDADRKKERARIMQSILSSGTASAKDAAGNDLLKVENGYLMGTGQLLEMNGNAKRKQTEIANGTKEASLDAMRPMGSSAEIDAHLFDAKSGMLMRDGMTEDQLVGALEAAIANLETAPIAEDEKMQLSAKIAERANALARPDKEGKRKVSAVSLARLKGKRDLMKLSPHLAAADGTKADGFTSTAALYDQSFLANIASLTGQDISGKLAGAEFRTMLAQTVDNTPATDKLTKDKISRALATSVIPRDGEPLQGPALENVFDVVSHMADSGDRQNAMGGLLGVVSAREEVRKMFEGKSCTVTWTDAAGVTQTETCNAREAVERLAMAGAGTYATRANLSISVT